MAHLKNSKIVPRNAAAALNAAERAALRDEQFQFAQSAKTPGERDAGIGAKVTAALEADPAPELVTKN